MKKVFIVLITITIFSCSKENVYLKKDLIGCQCNDGTIVFRSDTIIDNTVINLSKDKNVSTEICTKNLVKKIITLDACDREIGVSYKTYNHGGIKRVFLNNENGQNEWLKIVFQYPRAHDSQISWVKPNSVRPNVQCSAIAVSTNQRCKNMTTNCSGKCWTHGG